ncbi:MAG: DUF5615 family PIN-like protein [Candidatus Aenigmatarchaeota archaeon]|nr:MAG: DUF5615 family PIN-like protein [Candidatus Aenigmarchaeota archaeon]
MKKRFLADDMLGSLVRWLRMIGYDTVYSKSLDLSDDEIVALAKKEGRTIVTRDRGLSNWEKIMKLLETLR